MVFINTYRHFIWHSSKHLLSPLLFSATLATDISWPRLPGNRSFIVSVVFEGFSRFFWYMFLKIFCGFEKAVRKVMISRVKFHILMRSSTVIWSRNIMCGTAPSYVWYIQHLVQDRDLVQHHDLEPQEEQS